MLVKYSCGCIALRQDAVDIWILDYCSRDAYDNTFCIQEKVEGSYPDLDGRNYDVLRKDQVKKVMDELSRLVDDGYAMRTIQDVLKPRCVPYRYQIKKQVQEILEEEKQTEEE